MSQRQRENNQIIKAFGGVDIDIDLAFSGMDCNNILELLDENSWTEIALPQDEADFDPGELMDSLHHRRPK